MSPAPHIGEVVIGLPSWTPYAAVAVSGLAGATYAARRGFDVIGVLGLAISTGLGGLLLRDVLLENGTPVILTDPIYLTTAAITAVIGFFFAGLISRLTGILTVLDGLSLGFLCTIGALPAIREDLGIGPAIFFGVITATGGLVLRDIMAGEAPDILRPGVFVGVAALIGSVTFVLMVDYGINAVTAQITTIILVMLLRLLSQRLGWRTKPSVDISDRVWNFWSHKDQTEQLSIADITQRTPKVDK